MRLGGLLLLISNEGIHIDSNCKRAPAGQLLPASVPLCARSASCLLLSPACHACICHQCHSMCCRSARVHIQLTRAKMCSLWIPHHLHKRYRKALDAISPAGELRSDDESPPSSSVGEASAGDTPAPTNTNIHHIADLTCMTQSPLHFAIL